MRTLLAALLLLIQLFSLAQTATVVGQIKNRPLHSIAFYTPEDPIKGNITIGQIKTDSLGNFSFQFYLKERKPIRLSYKASDNANDPSDVTFIIWMEPEKNLGLNISNDSTIHYYGQLARENNLLKALGFHRLLPGEVYDTSSFLFDIYSRSQNMMVRKRTALLNAAKARNSISAAFTRYAQTEITYNSVFNKIQYAIEYTSAKNINYKQLNPPASFRTFISGVDFLTDDSYYSLKYRHGLWRYFDYLSFTTLQDTTESYTLHTFRLLEQKLKKSPKTRAYLKNHYLKFTFSIEQNIDTLRECITSIERENPKSETVAYFENNLFNKIKLLYSNKTLPDIALQDTTGALVSLISFKGKVLLIDFWGSWCKPCMEEMPYSKRLYQQIDTSKIMFVYINTGDTKSKWQETIKKLDLEGIHLHADKGVQEQLQSYYVFNAYPYYVVTDTDGKPFIAKDPIRPSNNAKEVLNAFIAKKSNVQ